MLQRATPTVVSVATAERVRVLSGSSPEQDIIRRFLGLPPAGPAQVEEQEIPQGVGSGVILTSDGFIITNNHVITNSRGNQASNIQVTLHDGRTLDAEVVGRDPRTDIAVIKVDAQGLTAIPLADSDEVLVGDVVFAIGNPLGVGRTVTGGIVSATGRAIGIYGEGGYEDFIQTDASINPGNSGGALVDAHGRLVGVNSAILSRTGANIGIGFAIPSRLAAAIAEHLVRFGEVRRGYLGIAFPDEPEERAAAALSYGHPPTAEGALVLRIIEETPAAAAGLQEGDLIIRYANRPIRNENDLRIRIAQTLPGTTVTLLALAPRQSTPREIEVSVGDLEAMSPVASILPGVEAAPLSRISAQLRQQLALPPDAAGLLVTEVDQRSPAAQFLAPGMLLVDLNGVVLSSHESFRDALRDGQNTLSIYFQGRLQSLSFRR
jgi:serine protease Do